MSRSREELPLDPNFQKLCKDFGRHHNYNPSASVWGDILSCVTNFAGLEPLGWYHARKIWDEIPAAQRPVLSVLDTLSSGAQTEHSELVSVIVRFFRDRGILSGVPSPYALAVWDLDTQWDLEQWRSQITEMSESTINTIDIQLKSKIMVPWNAPTDNINEQISHSIFTLMTSKNKGIISPELFQHLRVHLTNVSYSFWSARERYIPLTNGIIRTSFHFCFPHTIFGLMRRNDPFDTWKFNEEGGWDFPIFVYPVKEGSGSVQRYMPHSDWSVTNKHGIPFIISETVSGKGGGDEHRLCHQAVALLKLIYHVLDGLVSRADNQWQTGNQTQTVRIMALYTSQEAVTRYVFSFTYPNSRIEWCCKRFVFASMTDLGELWLELWNARTLFAQQLSEFPKLKEELVEFSRVNNLLNAPSLRGSRAGGRRPGRSASSSRSPSPLASVPGPSSSASRFHPNPSQIWPYTTRGQTR